MTEFFKKSVDNLAKPTDNSVKPAEFRILIFFLLLARLNFVSSNLSGFHQIFKKTTDVRIVTLRPAAGDSSDPPVEDPLSGRILNLILRHRSLALPSGASRRAGGGRGHGAGRRRHPRQLRLPPRRPLQCMCALYSTLTRGVPLTPLLLCYYCCYSPLMDESCFLRCAETNKGHLHVGGEHGEPGRHRRPPPGIR
jgi:hypothetical protein